MYALIFVIVIVIVLFIIVKNHHNRKQTENQAYNKKENKLKTYIESSNELLLSKDEFIKTYNIIKKKVIKNKYPVDSPIAITLGGQPGAGKKQYL